METRPPPFILVSHSSLSYTTSLTIGFRTQVGKSSKVSHPKLPETSKRRERNKEFYQRPKGTTTNDTTLGLCLNSLFGWFFVLFFFIIICIFLLIEFFQSYVCSSGYCETNVSSNSSPSPLSGNEDTTCIFLFVY